jgi:hypothetical protein
VCYGTQGDGLPSAADVAQLYQSRGINAIYAHLLPRRHHPAGPAWLRRGIDVVVDETNLDTLISDTTGWVQANFNPTRTTSSSSTSPSATMWKAATRRR